MACFFLGFFHFCHFWRIWGILRKMREACKKCLIFSIFCTKKICILCKLSTGPSKWLILYPCEKRHFGKIVILHKAKNPWRFKFSDSKKLVFVKNYDFAMTFLRFWSPKYSSTFSQSVKKCSSYDFERFCDFHRFCRIFFKKREIFTSHFFWGSWYVIVQFT